MIQPLSRSYWRFVPTILSIYLITLIGYNEAMAEGRSGNALLEAGTVIPVRLKDTLSSKDSRKGDAFSAILRVEDKGNYSGLPGGTLVEGTVREVKRKRDNDPGMLNLDFHRLRLPNGRSYPIQGSLIGLDEKSVSRTNDGRLVARPAHKDDRSAFVGYGAGIGMIVGLIRKRPLEDSLLGAGLGYLLGTTQRSRTEPRDVVLKEGTELGVRLDGRFRYAELDESESDDASALSESRKDIPTRKDHEAAEGHIAGSEIEVRGNVKDIGVLIDEDEVEFDANARPLVSNGKILVPILSVLRCGKIKHNYDRDRQELTILGKEGTLKLSAGSKIALFNGSKRIRMTTSVQRLNGTIYVPMNLLNIVFDCNSEWDEATRTIIVTTNEKDEDASLPENPLVL